MNISVERAPRRAFAVLLALALAVSMLALAPAAFAQQEPDVQRIAGPDRFGTAAEVARETYPDGADNVIIAAGFRFPDSLASAGLAGLADAPILLVNDVLDEATQATLDALDELDPDTLWIAGGDAAVSLAIEAQLAAAGDWDIERFSGTDRFDTAALMAEQFDPDDVDTVAVATGRVAADSLSVGPLAFHGGIPILLTEVNSLPDRTAEVLADLDPDTVLILGGTAAVSAGVEAEIAAAADADTERLAGATRFETAVAIAEYAHENFPDHFDLTEVSLATGFGPTAFALDGQPTPADALTSAPYGGTFGSPLLPINDVLDQLPPAIEAFLMEHAATIDLITVFGGTAAVSQAVVDAAVAAATTDVQPAVTDRPELISATVESFAGTATAAGALIVRYQFDEEVDFAAPVAARFHVYRFDDTAKTAETTGDTAAFADDRRVVRVQFNAVTQATFNRITVAAVEFDAVRDRDNRENPEGAAPLQPATAAPTTATDAPDLLSIGNFRAELVVVDPRTLVDFTFDENANNLADGYRLLLRRGLDTDVITCTFVSGGGTTTHTVACPRTGTPSVQTADQVARGWVLADTVGDGAPGNTNVAQAADVTPPSDTPALVSATFDVDNDRVTYRFSEPVRLSDGTDENAAGIADLFNVYRADATTVHNADSVAVTVADRTVVMAQFPAASIIGTTVGAYVLADAVEERFSPFRENQFDEVRRVPEGPTAVPAGTTNAPDLVSVSAPVVHTTDLAGRVTQYRSTFTFDANIRTASCIADRFLLYAQAGGAVRMPGSAVPHCGTGDAAANQAIVVFNVVPAPPGTPVTQDPATAVLGTVMHDAVDHRTTELPNPEGARPVN